MPNYSQGWMMLDANLSTLKAKQQPSATIPKPPPPTRPTMKTSNSTIILVSILILVCSSVFASILEYQRSERAEVTILRLQTRTTRLEAHMQQQSERIRTLERAMIAQPQPPAHRHLHKLLQRKDREVAR